MEIKYFDIKKGIYSFVTKDINAADHQHPALEIVLALEGTFDVNFEGGATLKNIKACIIRANSKHSVTSKAANCNIILIENEPQAIKIITELLGIENIDQAVMAIDLKKHPLFNENNLKPLFDIKEAFHEHLEERVLICQQFIQDNLLNQPIALDRLSKLVHLSQSRLSHLFKTQMGISIQNYIIWMRLKNTIQIMLDEELNLLQSAYRAGFHDLAHFSKAFKKMFGLNPSEVYNSRIIQI